MSYEIGNHIESDSAEPNIADIEICDGDCYNCDIKKDCDNYKSE